MYLSVITKVKQITATTKQSKDVPLDTFNSSNSLEGSKDFQNGSVLFLVGPIISVIRVKL